ncbi:MAG: hypothetical protein U1D55_18265 [Phycisphaerae bacterium]
MAPREFADAKHYRPAEVSEQRGVRLPMRFTEIAEEYRHARESAGLIERGDRALVRVDGKDRYSWLHNLVTNEVKKLEDDRGVYAFAIDVRGRVQLDMNILSFDGALWLDLDTALVDAALRHLNRFLISEDVQLATSPAPLARLAIAGPKSTQVAQQVAGIALSALPELGSAPIARSADVGSSGFPARLLRHDFAGVGGFELIVPREQAPIWWDRLAEIDGVRPIGQSALDVLRIEAGIPWMGRDIDDKTVPPEAGQVARSISYQKGCYLGQEIIERMRSHGSLSRRLVRVACDAGEGLAVPTPLRSGAQEVGRVTSLVRHPLRDEWIGLGYLRTTHKPPLDLTAGEPPRTVRVEELP